jgi:hypothetical protein
VGPQGDGRDPAACLLRSTGGRLSASKGQWSACVAFGSAAAASAAPRQNQNPVGATAVTATPLRRYYWADGRPAARRPASAPASGLHRNALPHLPRMYTLQPPSCAGMHSSAAARLQRSQPCPTLRRQPASQAHRPSLLRQRAAASDAGGGRRAYQDAFPHSAVGAGAPTRASCPPAGDAQRALGRGLTAGAGCSAEPAPRSWPCRPP